MQRWNRVAIIALSLVLVTMGNASAITFGEPDNGRHPNVGTMVLETTEGFVLYCSGTLIAEDVFLTASHCEPPEQFRGAEVLNLYVTFDDIVDLESPTLIPGEFIVNEGFTHKQSDSGDIAVILLEYPAADVYPGIEPAILPTAGLLTDLQRAGALQNLVFTNVGYGALERELGGGPPRFPETVQRHMSTSSFNALTKAWLRLSQNPSTGDGGTCYGDSGGPQFIEWNGQTILVSLTVTGDAQCRATNVTYRLDTAAARTFLEQFVELP